MKMKKNLKRAQIQAMKKAGRDLARNINMVTKTVKMKNKVVRRKSTCYWIKESE
jgi:hypothetical protein